jgi:exodeoxyribonuclease VIII
MDIMIDLETLSLRTDAAIIQVGAVLFDPNWGGRVYNDRGFNRHVLVQDGGGSIDHGTLCFWLQEAGGAAMGKDLSDRAEFLSDVLRAFVAWPKEAIGLDWSAVGGVWAMGADFDLAVLKSAFARFGMAVPWHYRAARCCRTLFALNGERPQIDWTGFRSHDALDDAVGQAMQVQKAMGQLRGLAH